MEFLTVDDVARLMHVRPGRVYWMIRAGQAPSVHIGGRIHVPRAAFEQWYTEQTAKALASVTGKRAMRPAPGSIEYVP